MTHPTDAPETQEAILAVTQADRDAAASLAEWLTQAQLNWGGAEIWFTPAFPDDCRKGVWDNHDFVQAFARHRLRTTPAEQQSAREALIERIDRWQRGIGESADHLIRDCKAYILAEISHVR